MCVGLLKFSPGTCFGIKGAIRVPQSWESVPSCSCFILLDPLCLAVGKADVFVNLSPQIGQDGGPLPPKAGGSEFLPLGTWGNSRGKLDFKSLIFLRVLRANGVWYNLS